MNHNHLSPDAEFRYLITWFREFSEYEREDFLEILTQWLLKPNESSANVNGMSENCSKPTIFNCRMMLFRNWTSLWPDQLRQKLIDKLNEIDSDFVLKMNEILEARIEQTEQPEDQQPQQPFQQEADGLETIQNGVTELTVSDE